MDHSDDPILARLDRLTELVERRFDALDERLQGLEQEAGEILNLLVAIKSCLDCATEELIEDDDDEDDTDDDGAWQFIH